MKGLFSKVMGVIAGVVALFGISVGYGTASVANAKASVTNVTASVPDISGKSALYLEHGKSIGSSIGTLICQDHESHASHVSHGSHHSHSSGY